VSTMVNKSSKINIALDYSPYPAGRDEKDGPFGGERFRVDILLPRYKEAKLKGVELEVTLDGVKSFGSSFLEEAFGGLVRNERVEKSDLLKRLKIVGEEPALLRYKEAILRYISNAK
jgi:hypothetical protein